MLAKVRVCSDPIPIRLCSGEAAHVSLKSLTNQSQMMWLCDEDGFAIFLSEPAGLSERRFQRWTHLSEIAEITDE